MPGPESSPELPESPELKHVVCYRHVPYGTYKDSEIPELSQPILIPRDEVDDFTDEELKKALRQEEEDILTGNSTVKIPFVHSDHKARGSLPKDRKQFSHVKSRRLDDLQAAGLFTDTEVVRRPSRPVEKKKKPTETKKPLIKRIGALITGNNEPEEPLSD